MVSFIASLNISTSAKEIDPNSWLKVVNKRIDTVKQTCHKTNDYQLYVLETQIHNSNQLIDNLKELEKLQNLYIENQSEEITLLENKIHQNYASYRKLGGVLPIDKIKPSTDPCQLTIAAELKSLSYIALVQARYKHQAPVVYPRKEIRRDRSGTVVLDFVINNKGKAKNIKVVSATSVAFQNSAIKALKASTFYITMKNGKAFHQRATRKYVFDIEKTQTK